jgi:hypothetical protein
VLNDGVPVPEFLDQLAVWKGQTPETDAQWHSIAGGVKDKAELAAKQAEKIPNIQEFFLGKAEAERKSQAQGLGLRPFRAGRLDARRDMGDWRRGAAGLPSCVQRAGC